MSMSEKIKALAGMLREKEQVKKEGKGVKDIGLRMRLDALRGKISKIRALKGGAVNAQDVSQTEQKRLSDMKARIDAIRSAKVDKKAEEGATTNADSDKNVDTMDKDYSTPEPKPDIATPADLAKAKDDALSQLPPTMLAEDVREAFKRAVKLAWAKYNKNLEKPHPLKSALFKNMADYGIKPTVAVALIDAAFEKAADSLLETIFKRAEEVAKYAPEAVAQLENEVQLTCTVIPAVEDEASAEDDEIVDRVVEGSFKLPKVGSAQGDNGLSRAVAKYNVMS